METLKEIIKQEVRKLNKAVLEHIGTEDDDLVICELIVRSIRLIDLYRGRIHAEDFIKELKKEEDIKYYSNLLIPIEHEVRDS